MKSSNSLTLADLSKTYEDLSRSSRSQNVIGQALGGTGGGNMLGGFGFGGGTGGGAGGLGPGQVLLANPDNFKWQTPYAGQAQPNYGGGLLGAVKSFVPMMRRRKLSIVQLVLKVTRVGIPRATKLI